jgi:hypothetical protein
MRRRLLLFLGAVIVAVARPIRELRSSGQVLGVLPDVPGEILMVVLLFAYVVMCYLAAQKFSSLPGFIRRHPQLCLHAGFWVLVAALWMSSPKHRTMQTLLAGCALIMPLLLWRLGYMLFTAQRGKMRGTCFSDHLLYIWPVWGGTSVPYGKGLDYLNTVEAKTDEALARSQLAGIKLFGLALICAVGNGLIDGLVFGHDNGYRRLFGNISLGIPTTAEMMLKPNTFPVWAGWVSIYCDLFQRVLEWGVTGHVVIGFLRLGGFYVFRNTYKPLLAETIVEFWNRLYYYFKELLVTFFFFPTYARCFKQSPRLRMFAAVFAAAFVGNMYYHTVDAMTLVHADWQTNRGSAAPRFFYCFMLALGIYISMLRQQRRQRTTTPRPWQRRAMAIFGVWTFFAVIHIWSTKGPPFPERLKFFLGLFGIA